MVITTSRTRFKKITPLLDDLARARLCDQSSGSERSSAVDDDVSVSDLVDSFLLINHHDVVVVPDDHDDHRDTTDVESSSDITNSLNNSMEIEIKEYLYKLIADNDDDTTKQMIRKEIENAYGNYPPEEFKRRAMRSLRRKGIDAGLCKSRWEKTAKHLAGEYEYIDVIISKTRYIVEVSIAAQFTIARPTNAYVTLIEMLPHIIVCKESEMKGLVRHMCNAMRMSMQKREIQVPPWRRNGYMQCKWFGSYRRTTNPSTTSSSSSKMIKVADGLVGTSLVGFETAGQFRNCGVEMEMRKVGGLQMIGKLTCVFNEMAD